MQIVRSIKEKYFILWYIGKYNNRNPKGKNATTLRRQ